MRVFSGSLHFQRGADCESSLVVDSGKRPSWHGLFSAGCPAPLLLLLFSLALIFSGDGCHG